jgi:hypothetical protein
MSGKFPKYQCLCCLGKFECGGSSWPISPVRAWADAMICNKCRSANWDGIVPTTYHALAAHLKAHGITPQENVRGWWPIPQ